MGEDARKRGAGHGRRGGWTGFLVHGIRYFDVLINTTYATLGAVLAMPGITADNLARFAFFSAANFLFITNVFIYNDLSDALKNPDEPGSRVRHALKDGSFSPGQVRAVGLGFLVLGLIGFLLIDPRIAALAVLLELITRSYSHPRINFKGRPGASSAVHFFGSSLYLICGWIVFAPLNAWVICLAVFMGITLCGGHFSNEIQDFAADFKAGIRTNTVALGQRTAFRLGLALFILAAIFFTASSIIIGANPAYTAAGVALTLVWIAAAYHFRSFKGGDSVRGFRSFYRTVYAAFTLALGLIRLSEILWGA